MHCLIQLVSLQVVSQTPVQARQLEEQHVSRLMEVQVDLEDQTYAHQLDCALRGQRRAGDGGRLAGGFRSLPIEEVLPAPEHIPESFRGKTWAQIEQEDEEKVEKLVKQFRKEKFVCYFDSESLARYRHNDRSVTTNGPQQRGFQRGLKSTKLSPSGLEGDGTERRNITRWWSCQTAASCPYWTVSMTVRSASRGRGRCSRWHPGVR